MQQYIFILRSAFEDFLENLFDIYLLYTLIQPAQLQARSVV